MICGRSPLSSSQYYFPLPQVIHHQSLSSPKSGQLTYLSSPPIMYLTPEKIEYSLYDYLLYSRHTSHNTHYVNKSNMFSSYYYPFVLVCVRVNMHWRACSHTNVNGVCLCRLTVIVDSVLHSQSLVLRVTLRLFSQLALVEVIEPDASEHEQVASHSNEEPMGSPSNICQPGR